MSFSMRLSCRNLTIRKVVYAAGVNEKLLGDFIRKHNLRDKIFGGLLY